MAKMEMTEDEVIERGNLVEQVTNMKGWTKYILPLIGASARGAFNEFMNLDTRQPNLLLTMLTLRDKIILSDKMTRHIEEWIDKKDKILQKRLEAKQINKEK